MLTGTLLCYLQSVQHPASVTFDQQDCDPFACERLERVEITLSAVYITSGVLNFLSPRVGEC